MMEPKEILQINATVIAGLLVLLTVASFTSGQFPDTNKVFGTPIQAAFITIIPFVISSVLASFSWITFYAKKKERKYFVIFSLTSMLIGFAYVGVYLTYLVFTNS